MCEQGSGKVNLLRSKHILDVSDCGRVSVRIWGLRI